MAFHVAPWTVLHPFVVVVINVLVCLFTGTPTAQATF